LNKRSVERDFSNKIRRFFSKVGDGVSNLEQAGAEVPLAVLNLEEEDVVEKEADNPLQPNPAVWDQFFSHPKVSSLLTNYIRSNNQRGTHKRRKSQI